MNPRAQTRMTDWNAVEDELPAVFDGPILLHFDNGSIETVNCEDFFKPITAGLDENGEQKRTYWYLHHSPAVTHWALVPAPPTH